MPFRIRFTARRKKSFKAVFLRRFRGLIVGVENQQR